MWIWLTYNYNVVPIHIYMTFPLKSNVHPTEAPENSPKTQVLSESGGNSEGSWSRR